AAPHLCQMMQKREISVGLHRETYCVRNLAEPTVKLAISIRNGSAAIDIGRCSERDRGRDQVGALAKNVLHALLCRGLFPSKMRRILRRIEILQFLSRIGS